MKQLGILESLSIGKCQKGKLNFNGAVTPAELTELFDAHSRVHGHRRVAN